MAGGIKLTKVGNRIHIKPTTFLGGDKFAEYLARCRTVPGCTYSKKFKCQTAPLDLEVCRTLREAFGKALEIDPELAAWARAEVEVEGRVREVSTMDMTKPARLDRVPVVAPRMWEAMQNRAFQTVPAKFASLVGSFLNADEPGLGKTIETFGAILETGLSGRVLVIAPASALRTTWEYEINKWLGDMDGGAGVWVADETAKQRYKTIHDFYNTDTRHRLDFLVVNAEMLRLRENHYCPLDDREHKDDMYEKRTKGCDGTDPYCDAADDHYTVREGSYPELFTEPWAAQIGDEIHKYMTNANPRARGRVSQVGLGIHKLPLAAGGLRLPLTGTPMKGKPRLVWPILHWTRPEYYTSERRFKEMYFEQVIDPYAYGGKKFIDEVREDKQAAFDSELDRTMVRRTKAELYAINPSWAPPPKDFHPVPIYLGTRQRGQYQSVERTGTLVTGTEQMLVNGTLAVRTRLKQLAGCAARVGAEEWTPVLPSAKFEWLVDSLLQSLGITGDPKTEQGEGKVVVASQFTQFINLWASELRKKKIQCHVLTGESSAQERLQAQQEFQGYGGPRVFLLNTHAGGVSLTLDAADDIVVMDHTENPDDQTQVIDRVHRTSNVVHQVNVWLPYVVDTIEEEIVAGNEYKDQRQKRHLDERRGVTFAKQVTEVS